MERMFRLRLMPPFRRTLKLRHKRPTYVPSWHYPPDGAQPPYSFLDHRASAVSSLLIVLYDVDASKLARTLDCRPRAKCQARHAQATPQVNTTVVTAAHRLLPHQLLRSHSTFVSHYRMMLFVLCCLSHIAMSLYCYCHKHPKKEKGKRENEAKKGS